MQYVNLHHHSHYSIYDGAFSPTHGVQYAKELGYAGLALTDHGMVSGLVEHYYACVDAGIHPILGVEAYFQPVFDKDARYYHMLLFAKNMEGYHHLMQALSEGYRDKYYRHPIMDWETLEAYAGDMIATSGCIAGYIPQLLIQNDIHGAVEALQRFQQIFPDRFYLEVQPFSVLGKDPAIEVPEGAEDARLEVNLQKRANTRLIKLGKKYHVPVVLTLDSHYVHPDDYDSYLIKYQVGGRLPIANYAPLHLQSIEGIQTAWTALMGTDATPYMEETWALASQCHIELKFKEMVPKIDWGKDPLPKLVELAKDGLRAKGLWADPRYKTRLAYELKLVRDKGYVDYFLLCYDIISWAKNNGVRVGFGRGSVCGSLLAYAMGITEIDPIIMGTAFERFLQPDRTTMPDIDVDYDSENRERVIAYVLERYSGRSAQIASYGVYQVKNLINDLAKILGMDPEVVSKAKTLLESHEEDDTIGKITEDRGLKKIDQAYPGFLKHFSKLYGQVRYIGKHAAGIAVTPDDITKYVAIMRVRGGFMTSYDMDRLSKLNLVKMDELGLSAMSVIKDIEEATGAIWNYKNIADPVVYERFAKGETAGIFQFEKQGAVEILRRVQPTNIQDIVACNALNRPAPIKLGILDAYIEGKIGHVDTTTPWYQFTADTYGTILYQEHVMQISRNIGKLNWVDTDHIVKKMHKVGDENKADPIRDRFIEGAVAHSGLTEADARSLYGKMTLYLFNKGHGTAYSVIAYYMMWLKTYYPLEFWWAILKNEHDDKKREILHIHAASEGIILLLPHVNASQHYSIEEIDGGKVIRLGISALGNIGIVSAKAIEANRPYTSIDDLMAKIPKRQLNARVLKVLENAGALEFNEKKFMRRVSLYNGQLWRKVSMGNRGKTHGKKDSK